MERPHALRHDTIVLLGAKKRKRPIPRGPDRVQHAPVPFDAVAAEVRLCVVSMSARHPEGLDAAYLEWHALDHLPEQYGIGALAHGQRWVSTPACRAARVADDDRFARADHVVQYLFAEPVDPALERFFELGAQLRAAGRMPLRLPPVELGGYELEHRAAAAAALVRAEVVPWRPATGAYLLVERSGSSDVVDALLDIDGVAGVWRYRGGVFHDRLADTTGLHLSVCYLDRDPAATGGRIGEVVTALGRDALLAAPFEALVPWAWERALP
jgi:hypothetical protein